MLERGAVMRAGGKPCAVDNLAHLAAGDRHFTRAAGDTVKEPIETQ
jgi:hypothetical protein